MYRSIVDLASSECEKDLGINIDNKLKFSKHIEIQVNKANKILGLIRRSYQFLDCKSLKQLFVALVRPHLEYGNSVWSPKLEKDKQLIESVLRRATKLMPSLNKFEYEERLKKFNLPSMSYRRIRGDLIEAYKFVHGFYNAKCPLNFNQNRTTRGHSFKLNKEHCNTSNRQHFFANRIIDTWNSLEEEIVNASSINSFKNKIDTVFKEYIHKPDISMPLKPLKLAKATKQSKASSENQPNQTTTI